MGTGAGTIGREPPGRHGIEQRIRELRTRVYGRNPRPEDVAALAAALTQLPAAPPAAPPAPPTAHRVEVPAEEPLAGPPPAPQPGVLASAAASVRSVPPRLLLTGVAVAVIAALAGAAGLLIVEHPAGADPAVPRSTAAVSVAADPAVLDRAPRSVDRSTALVGPDLEPGSFRRLAAYPAAGVTIWAARDRFGETCLVAVDTYYRSACTDAPTLHGAGLVLQWCAGPGSPVSTTESYTAVWRHGRLVAGRSTS